MQSRKLSLALLALALGACSVDLPDQGTSETKQAARDRMQRAAQDGDVASAGRTDPAPPTSAARPRPTPPDVCLARNWYDDGECDAWCPRGDPGDCAPSGGGVICAEFFSPADGYCDPRDPCGPIQDEDCQKGDGCDPVGDPTGEPRPVPGDGKCEPKSCEELRTDADCRELACPAIFSPADGKCEPRGACDFVIDEDCAKPCSSSGGGTTPCDPGSEPDACGRPTNPIICPAIRYEDNGKCEAPPACKQNDPIDCAVACDAIRYPTNGKCEAPPGCEANDPGDCRVTACRAILYPDNGVCEAAPGCETSDPKDCGGVACIDIAYPTNGKCEAAPGCEANDPRDCGGVICLTILYPENGKCEAAPGCESSDPDC
jgi:hypothetical protein